MKKTTSFIWILALLSAFVFGCAKAAPEQGNTQADSGEARLSVVTTIFPEYDWVRNIMGDQAKQADVSMLLDSGVDLHSFQPTADDIIRISDCDIFVYVGGESDDWVEDALKEAKNPEMIVVNLLEALGDAAKEEEIVEGMEADHDENHADEDHEEGEDHDHEGPEYDEHVWLSLKNAVKLVDVLKDALSEADPAHAEAYAKNAAAYTEKLNALDEAYAEAVSAAPRKTVLFGDRFPFRYLTDDYGLTYYAAFVGCSAETEASFETIAFLSEKVDELGLHTVLSLEGSNRRIAETVISSSSGDDVRILSMDSMQSTTRQDVASGTTFLSVMEKNLEVLKEALR